MTTKLEQIDKDTEQLDDEGESSSEASLVITELEDIEGGEDDDDDDDDDVNVYTYIVTYQNGVLRQVFTTENVDEVLQRLSTNLGKKKPSLMRFPPQGELFSGDEPLPVFVIRSDLVLDIGEVVEVDDGDDEESLANERLRVVSGGEPAEAEPEPAAAQPPQGKASLPPGLR